VTSRDDRPGTWSGETLSESVHVDDATLPAASVEPGRDQLRGKLVGRYLLGEPIGHGGMGVVYQARDPQLDRELAIKVVLPQASDQRAQERLLGEARAMAKLRHPAVVPVFDVGATEHGVYVVMPLVGGGTLHDWLAQPRPWREVATRFLAAGRGLAAAHAVGLVHRDFKSRNVLVDEHGAVAVADFGLASEAAPPPADGSPRQGASSISGTPAYMAPEQAAGVRVDARADQYSFCVALWEGMYGHRPQQPAPAPPASGQRELPPDWLRAVIERGLERDPERRWPSMDALLGEIERRGAGVLSRRRPVAPWIVAGVIVLATGIAVTYLTAGDRATTAPPAAPPAPPALALGTPRPLTTTGGCAENPLFVDAHAVVFDLTRGDEVNLHLVDLDGSPPRQLTQAPTWEWRAARGLRPREVLFLREDQIDHGRSSLAALDLDTGAVHDRIASPVTGVAAVGDAIYYAHQIGTELRVRRGADDALLGNYPRSGLGPFAIDPGGVRIAYTGIRSGPVCYHRLPAEKPTCVGDRIPAQVPVFSRGGAAVYVGARDGVHRFELDGGRESVISPVEAPGGLAIAPDGRHLVVSSCIARSRVVDLTATPERPLVSDPNSRSPALGPRGAMAWVRVSPRGDRVLVARAPDGTIRQVTSPDLGNITDPAFDPAGTAIAFQVTGHEPGIYVVDVAVGYRETRRLTDQAGDTLPAWVGPGRLVFLRTERGVARAFAVGLDHRQASELHARSRPMLTANPATGEVLLHNTDAVRLVWWSAATGRERPGPAGAPELMQGASVSPSGRWLLVQSGATGNVMWRAALPEGALEKVHEEGGGRTFGRATIDDDGHVIASPAEWKGELSVLDVIAGTL
jgi:hypothetical protein